MHDLTVRVVDWWLAGDECSCAGLREPREFLAAHPQLDAVGVIRSTDHGDRLLRSEGVCASADSNHSTSAHSDLLHVLQEQLLPVHQSGVALRGVGHDEESASDFCHRASVHAGRFAGRSPGYPRQAIQFGYSNRRHCQCSRLNFHKLQIQFKLGATTNAVQNFRNFDQLGVVWCT